MIAIGFILLVLFWLTGEAGWGAHYAKPWQKLIMGGLFFLGLVLIAIGTAIAMWKYLP